MAAGIKVDSSNKRYSGITGGFSVQRKPSGRVPGPSMGLSMLQNEPIIEGDASVIGLNANDASGSGMTSMSTPRANRDARAGSRSASSPSPKRRMYYAVARGHQIGIYESWGDAEQQIKGHPSPSWKTFKTRLAAESYIQGAAPFPLEAPEDAATGGYDMQLPYPVQHPYSASRDLPLHERLQRDFPSTTPASSSTPSSGPSSLRSSPSLPDLQPPRPHFARSTSGSSSRSGSGSPMARSSPLRQEVTDDEGEGKSSGSSRRPSHIDLGSDADAENDHVGAMQSRDVKEKKKGSRFSLNVMAKITGGMLSPPTSPESAARGTRPFRVDTVDRSASGVLAPPIVLPPADYTRSTSRNSIRSSRSGRSERSSSRQGGRYGAGDVEAAEAYEGRPPSMRSVSSASSLGGKGLPPPPPPAKSLWADSTPPASPPLSPPPRPMGMRDRSHSNSGSDAESESGMGMAPSLSSAPKFSRSALRKSGVLLPVSAKEMNRSGSVSTSGMSSPGLSRSSSPSMSRPLSPSGSISGLRRKSSNNSLASLGSIRNLHDKLASLSETMISGGLVKEEGGEHESGMNGKRPKLDGSRTGSQQSVESFASFATARDDPVVIVTGPGEKPLPNVKAEDDTLKDHDDVLAPTTSHASGSDEQHTVHSSEYSYAQSDATHTRSEGGKGGQFPDVRAKQKKVKGFGKFFRALGLTKVDEGKGERRLSA